MAKDGLSYAGGTSINTRKTFWLSLQRPSDDKQLACAGTYGEGPHRQRESGGPVCNIFRAYSNLGIIHLLSQTLVPALVYPTVSSCTSTPIQPDVSGVHEPLHRHQRGRARKRQDMDIRATLALRARGTFRQNEVLGRRPYGLSGRSRRITAAM